MNKTAMVVDDNRLMLDFMTRVISEKGYDVTTATDGFEALDLLTGTHPDIIFVDLVMPRIEGDNLCRIIRKMPHLNDCYIVVVSAAAAEMAMDIESFGANAIIAKGAFNDMAEHIHSVLDSTDRETLTLDGPAPVLGLDSVHPRQMTKELLARNRHLVSILESISDGILEVFTGRVVYANKAALHLFDSSLEKITGAELIDQFDPAERAKVERLLAADNDAEPMPMETDVLQLNQREVVVRRLALGQDTDSCIVLMTDITEKRRAERQLRNAYRDLEERVRERTAELTQANEALKQEVAERKRTELALKESKERFELFMKHLSGLAFMKDADGRYLYANDAYRHLMGMPPP